jgi:hypothetical protein
MPAPRLKAAKNRLGRDRVARAHVDGRDRATARGALIHTGDNGAIARSSGSDEGGVEMLDKLGLRLSYANVMATLAMFAILGGGAYAAATIGADDIKKNAVRSKHIKKKAVTAPKLAMRPVKLNFTGPANTPPTTLLDKGGIKISPSCSSGGTAQLRIESTAEGNLVKVVVVGSGPSPSLSSFQATGPAAFTPTTSGANPFQTVTITIRTAGGTTVTGDVVNGQNAGVAQCVIAGTLFVG